MDFLFILWCLLLVAFIVIALLGTYGELKEWYGNTTCRPSRPDPTCACSPKPTNKPISIIPTIPVTRSPTRAPVTPSPTRAPTRAPYTMAPTRSPTRAPTMAPTVPPVSMAPTRARPQVDPLRVRLQIHRRCLQSQ